jgi:hypothetical protein
MAACTAVAKLTRFVVRIKENCGTSPAVLDASAGYVFQNCIKASGLTLGEEGNVTVPQWGVTGMLADGQRTLAPLGLDFRVDDNLPTTAYALSGTNNVEKLVEMYSRRADIKYDIEVAITDRAFKALFIYKFKQCDMRVFKSDDQEIGAGKLGTIMTEFLPLDVELWSCSATATSPKVAGRNTTAATWSNVTC